MLYSLIEFNLAMICANAPALTGLWKHLRERKRTIPRALRHPEAPRGHHELERRIETGMTSTEADTERSSQDA